MRWALLFSSILLFNLSFIKASEILLLKYDKLIPQSDGTSEANTTGYDLTSLNSEYFSPIKVDRLLLLDSVDFSINIANKTSWSGGADTTSIFYTNGY